MKKKEKVKMVEVFTNEQYNSAKAKGLGIIDRRLDDKFERAGESEYVDFSRPRSIRDEEGVEIIDEGEE